MTGVTLGWPALKARAGYADASDFDDVSMEQPPAGSANGAVVVSTNKTIRANLFTLGDPRSIPPREWLYGRHYARRFLSATVAPGGGGKSALAIVESLAMATGKNLVGVLPAEPLRVWYWNGEDPRDELQRRVTAACMHYNIAPQDIGDRLFINSGRDSEIILARDDRTGIKIALPVIGALRREIRDLQLDVLYLDPFVASHAVPENDNGKINAVCRELAMQAEETNCAIELVHHVRKGSFGQGEYTWRTPAAPVHCSPPCAPRVPSIS
jgi:RecA-family ATPase